MCFQRTPGPFKKNPESIDCFADVFVIAGCLPARKPHLRHVCVIVLPLGARFLLDAVRLGRSGRPLAARKSFEKMGSFAPNFSTGFRAARCRQDPPNGRLPKNQTKSNKMKKQTNTKTLRSCNLAVILN